MSRDLVRNIFEMEMPHPEVLINDVPLYESYFEIIKEEIAEMSVESAELRLIGTLAEILGESNFDGSISLKKRLESGEITTQELDKFTKTIEASFVSTSPGAPLRCVDGRSEMGYDESDPNSYGKPRGPQVQGGVIDEAAASRLNEGFVAGSTLLSDVKNSIESEAEFSAGSHDDDHGPLGCGAVKGQEAKLAYYTNPVKFQAIRNALFEVASMAGMKLPEDVIDHLPQNAQILLDNAAEYYGDKVEAINLVTKFNPNAKATVVGAHNEVALVINLVPDTTLHTNHLNALSDNKLQAFGLDAWRITNPVLIADALATVMNLTDGSLRVFVRMPAAEV